MSGSMYHWEFMGEMNPEELANWRAFYGGAGCEGAIPPKYRELMLCAMAYVQHAAPATLTHTVNAVETYGATREEIFTVLNLALIMGGAPAYRDACLVLEDYLRNGVPKSENK